MSEDRRIVITGLGLASPNGSHLAEFRKNLLEGVSGVSNEEIRYMGTLHVANCDYEVARYRKKKDARRGTRAGSTGIYCANEALKDAGIDLSTWEDRSRVGVYAGITEHGNVETENEIYELGKKDYDVRFWSHHHNPRTVANAPAGEISLNLKVTGPAYTIGAACAGGNAGLIQGVQQLLLGDVDLAIGGGLSEATHTFGIFAAFKAQNALASHEDPTKASRPFDKDRNGIVVAEGGAMYVLERLSDARKRGARILGEIVGWGINSDASDYVLPNPVQQAACIRLALGRARMNPEDVDLISTHGTATPSGDPTECKAIREVFGESGKTYVNNTKSYIGHAMGGAGALELAGNLPSFEDDVVHPTINVDNLDPDCELPNLVLNEPRTGVKVDVILNNSFGMLGINSTVIVKKFTE